MEFLVRFVCGGLLVASLPWVASHFGETVAGLILLLPVITLVGLTALALDRGMESVVQVSGAAVMTVPAVAVFLIAVNVAARHLSLPWTLAAGMGAWLAAAGAVVLIATTRGGQGAEG